jgi:1,4-dihydroxy-2-naphthoyl-CoA hydrolase
MKIWAKDFTLESLNQTARNTIEEQLGIRFTEIGDNYIKASMPVDHRTHQPFGILHGGASVVLAESLGSRASYLCLRSKDHIAVGVEINANHLKSVSEGEVTGLVKPIQLGRQLHVWEIRIYNSQEKLVCISRLTVAIVPKRPSM